MIGHKDVFAGLGIGPEGRTAFASALPQVLSCDEPRWSTLNARRLHLISRDMDGALSSDEKTELEQLEAMTLRRQGALSDGTEEDFEPFKKRLDALRAEADRVANS